MCHAIIEIHYRSASPVETIKATDAEMLASRLASLQENDQIERLVVFRPERVLTRQVIWTEAPIG